jgi:hypothetical protein
LSYRGKLTPKDFVHLFKLTTPTTWWLIPPRRDYYRLSYRGIIIIVYMKTLKKTMGKNFLEASIRQQVVDLARGEMNQ